VVVDHKEYLKLHKNLMDTMHQLTIDKQSDYCNNSSDPFYNVSRGERLGSYSTEVGLLTRINDKLARLESFIASKKMSVQDEKVLDTCMDAANYILMLGLYMTHKEKKEK
jgi:hypothetical protein